MLKVIKNVRESIQFKAQIRQSRKIAELAS